MSDEVWVVVRNSPHHDYWGTERPKDVVVAEYSSKESAEAACRDLDWGKDMGSTTWHHAKKVKKQVTYYD